MNIEVASKVELFKDLKAGDVFKIIIDGEGVAYCIKTPMFEDYEGFQYEAIDLENGRHRIIEKDDKVSPVKARLVVEE